MEYKKFNDVKKNVKNSNAGGNMSEQEVNDVINKYSGKSQTELMNEILKQVSQGRANGTLSDEQLKGFYNQVKPMLNAEQQKRLEEIMKVIS